MLNKNSPYSQTTLFALFVLMLAMVLVAVPDVAFAASWESAPKKLYDRLMGSFFGNLAALAIVALAILSLAGKVDWRWGIGIIVSIVVAFSAPEIVDTVKSWVV